MELFKGMLDHLVSEGCDITQISFTLDWYCCKGIRFNYNGHSAAAYREDDRHPWGWEDTDVTWVTLDGFKSEFHKLFK